MDPSSRLRNAHMCFILESLETWDDQDIDTKMSNLQAIAYLMLRSEKRGTSFRSLIDDLGVYPDAMMVSELLDIHNILWDHFSDNNQSKLVALPNN